MYNWRKWILLIVGFIILNLASAKDIHVSVYGKDTNKGTIDAPYSSISKAAQEAVNGDVVIIHGGTYREYINPPKGGTSNASRITFKAANNDEVFIKGSERIRNWENNNDNTWKVSLEQSFFKGYNPYVLNVDGDFQNYGQWHHRGDVYIKNGVLSELQTLEQVKAEPYTWYTETIDNITTIYANFGNEDPNIEVCEINVRELIFFATDPSVDYISLEGIRFLHAAPNWQAPNTGASDPNRLMQVGAVGSNMGKGWIIDNCEVQYSKTAGIMFGESANNRHTFEDIEAFGDHVISNCVITRCGEYGIAGQKGLSRSTIIGNRIEDINFRNEFGGYEPAGIKIWNNVDVHIENNLVRNCIANQSELSQAYCIWIDFANQGTRITRNFLVGAPLTTTPLFLEANVGPTLVDNNIIVDPAKKRVMVYSGGSIFAHNLFVNCGFHFAIQEFGNGGSGARNAYTFKKHTLEQTNANQKVEVEYNQLYNNIFAGGDGPIHFNESIGANNRIDYNLYVNGTKPSVKHTNATSSGVTINDQITDTDKGVQFSFKFDDSYHYILTPIVDANKVGVIPFADQTIEDKFGNPITVNSDFNHLMRKSNHPTVGPLENLQVGDNSITIETEIQPTKGAKFKVPVSITPDGGKNKPQAPFGGIAHPIPGEIEAENYDVGGEGVAFHDDAEKDGLSNIRPNDMVDIGGGGANGQVIAWFNADEWLEYTVHVEPGMYRVDVSAASGTALVGDLTLELNGKEIANLNINSTSDWNKYKEFSVENIEVQDRGKGILKVISSGGFNIDKLTFKKINALATTSGKARKTFQIFPNPVTDILNVKPLSSVCPQLEVFNALGQKVLSEQAVALDVSVLHNGFYLLLANNKSITHFIKN